nr:MAG TPA: hypothetical protein [Caudoviricetes sp.]
MYPLSNSDIFGIASFSFSTILFSFSDNALTPFFWLVVLYAYIISRIKNLVNNFCSVCELFFFTFPHRGGIVLNERRIL